MANLKINQFPAAVTIDGVNDVLPIWANASSTTKSISRNTFLAITGNPVGTTDSQTLTNKAITAPTISSPVLSGTVTGTYTIGGTPTFPSSVVTLTGSQTLTNKILTSPTINAPTITNANITADTVSGFSSANTGTIYGVGVTTGQISTASSVLPAALATGISYTKFKNDYKFSVYRSTTWGLNGLSLLIMDTKIFDTGNNYSTSTGLFTVPVNGFYWFNGYAGSNLSGGNGYGAGLFITSAIGGTRTETHQEATQGATGGFGAYASAHGFYQLNANDTVGFVAYNSNGTGSAGVSVNGFRGFLVSAT